MTFHNSDGKGDKVTFGPPHEDPKTRIADVTYKNRGGSAASTASTYQNSKYNVTQHEYPNGLMTNLEYGGNYAVFYINVQEDSKLLKNGSVTPVAESISMMGDRGPVTKRAASEADAVKAQAGATAGATGIAGGAILGKSGAAAASIPVILGGAMIASQAVTSNRTVKRIQTAIALNMPNLMSARYAVGWNEEETMGSQLIQEGFNAGMDGVGAAIKAFDSENTNSDLVDIARGDVGKRFQSGIAAFALSKIPNGGAISAQMGIASNPLKEQIFKGVEFRTFTYDYQFFPRNSTEAANIQRIIKTFKLHMYPEFKDAGNFIYIYPSEFDIYFYKDGKENLNVHRHTSCVLTDMSVNYTPNGNFSTFADGMPTQMNVSLTFRELALLDKDKIMDGM